MCGGDKRSTFGGIDACVTSVNCISAWSLKIAAGTCMDGGQAGGDGEFVLAGGGTGISVGEV